MGGTLSMIYTPFYGFKKRRRTSTIIGLNIQELRDYLEGKFEPWMSWGNYGEWEIDHIIPLSRATCQEQFEQLSYFTNLQPLKKSDNRIKNDRYEGEITWEKLPSWKNPIR